MARRPHQPRTRRSCRPPQGPSRPLPQGVTVCVSARRFVHLTIRVTVFVRSILAETSTFTRFTGRAFREGVRLDSSPNLLTMNNLATLLAGIYLVRLTLPDSST